MKKGALLQIAQLGNKVIRQKSKDVKNIKDTEIQKLIDDLEATCLDVDGVGIAAPQVYKSLNIFIIASHPNSTHPKAPKLKPFAVINPRIISKSKKITKGWEGCLSIPGIRGTIPRRDSIKVKYTNRNGEQITKKITGFVAIVFQHEYDHLQGKVIIDRSDPKDLITEKEFQRVIKLRTK